MAWTAKLTIKAGEPRPGKIAIAAGSSEAQTETMSLNIDATKMTKGQALVLLDDLKAAIFAGEWPIN